jgi:type IV pilus assembly protein PilF
MVRLWWLAMLLPAILTACAGRPASNNDNSQTPVSQQVAVGDAQQRAKAHVDLGMIYLSDGQLNTALDEARIAVEADSSYPLSHNLFGLVQMYLKNNQMAEDSFKRALGLAPTDPEINNNYGWFLCQSGREPQSIAYFVAASKSQMYSTPTKPLTNAGICSLSMKDDKGAEDFLARALRVDPMNGDAHFMLADLYYRTGRLSEARARLAEIHRMTEPTAETAWLGLRIERKLGDHEAESRYASQLRRKYQASREYQLMTQGKFE